MEQNRTSSFRNTFLPPINSGGQGLSSSDRPINSIRCHGSLPSRWPLLTGRGLRRALPDRPNGKAWGTVAVFLEDAYSRMFMRHAPDLVPHLFLICPRADAIVEPDVHYARCGPMHYLSLACILQENGRAGGLEALRGRAGPNQPGSDTKDIHETCRRRARLLRVVET